MHAKKWFALIVLGSLIGFAGPFSKTAYSQQQSAEARLEAKIAELEKRLREVETTRPVAASASAPLVTPTAYGGTAAPKANLASPVVTEGAGMPGREPAGVSSGGLLPSSGFPDGFIVHSADNRHQLRLTGQIQADYRSYPMKGDSTDIDQFVLRRARLGIEATLFDYYEFRFLPDWGSNRTVIQDAYMNVHYWDQFQFQVGKFKQPVSYEQLIQDRFVPTLERSLIDQIVPARDLGLMVHGQTLLNDHFDYALGIFNGTVNGDTDTNKLRDIAGRFAWRPFMNTGLPEGFHNLSVGISGSIGKETEPLSFNAGSSTPTTLRTPGNIPWLTFASTVRADGIRSRWTPEVAYFYRSFGIMTQYMHMDQEMRSGIVTVVGGKTVLDPIVNIPFEGYHVTATYLLTGEERQTFSQFISPTRPFDPLHPLASPGAYELVARVSHLQVGDEIFAPGNLRLANPKTNSHAATELTLGYNWYLNSHVRMQFNWEHAWFQEPLTLGTNAIFRQTNAALIRFQIIF